MKLTHWVLSALLGVGTLTLSGCGFALRGTQALPPAHSSVHIVLNDRQLKHALSQQLQLLGIQTGETPKPAIVVKNVRLRRYELIGTLTEIRLVLMADVDYQLASPHSTSLQVERSYQYNEASVVTLDQQGQRAQQWLYDDLAKRIAEQYRVLASQ